MMPPSCAYSNSLYTRTSRLGKDLRKTDKDEQRKEYKDAAGELNDKIDPRSGV